MCLVWNEISSADRLLNVRNGMGLWRQILPLRKRYGSPLVESVKKDVDAKGLIKNTIK